MQDKNGFDINGKMETRIYLKHQKPVKLFAKNIELISFETDCFNHYRLILIFKAIFLSYPRKFLSVMLLLLLFRNKFIMLIT